MLVLSIDSKREYILIQTTLESNLQGLLIIRFIVLSKVLVLEDSGLITMLSIRLLKRGYLEKQETVYYVYRSKNRVIYAAT